MRHGKIFTCAREVCGVLVGSVAGRSALRHPDLDASLGARLQQRLVHLLTLRTQVCSAAPADPRKGGADASQHLVPPTLILDQPEQKR